MLSTMALLGKLHYTNCEGTKTEVKIVKKNCSYSKHPMQFNDAAAVATAMGCGDHGSFDPIPVMVGSFIKVVTTTRIVML